MDRSEVISLIKVTQYKDEYGMTEYTDSRRDVFVNVRSVTSQEFFEANQAGMQPQLEFIMFGPDYEGERIVEYKGERYKVYRTYIRTTDMLELYVEKVASDGD